MKNISISFILTLLIAASAYSQSIFNGYAYVSDTTAGTDTIWYNLSGSGQSSSLQGADLGDFSTNLWLGGQTGFWSNGSGTQFVTLNYSITGQASASGTVNYAFQYFEGPAGTNNDQWGTDANGANASDLSVDLIAAHSLAAGDYNLVVYVEGKANNNVSAFDSNGGSNYSATFTVVPEPTSFALLLGFAGLCFVMYKRRLS